MCVGRGSGGAWGWWRFTWIDHPETAQSSNISLFSGEFVRTVPDTPHNGHNSLCTHHVHGHNSLCTHHVHPTYPLGNPCHTTQAPSRRTQLQNSTGSACTAHSRSPARSCRPALRSWPAALTWRISSRQPGRQWKAKQRPQGQAAAQQGAWEWLEGVLGFFVCAVPFPG